MFLENILMLFASSKEQRRQQKQLEEQILNSEDYLRRQMYKDIHSIKGWVKFWSWLSIIAIIIILLQMCSEKMVM